MAESGGKLRDEHVEELNVYIFPHLKLGFIEGVSVKAQVWITMDLQFAFCGYVMQPGLVVQVSSI